MCHAQRELKAGQRLVHPLVPEPLMSSKAPLESMPAGLQQQASFKSSGVGQDDKDTLCSPAVAEQDGPCHLLACMRVLQAFWGGSCWLWGPTSPGMCAHAQQGKQPDGSQYPCSSCNHAGHDLDGPCCQGCKICLGAEPHVVFLEDHLASTCQLSDMHATSAAAATGNARPSINH